MIKEMKLAEVCQSRALMNTAPVRLEPLDPDGATGYTGDGKIWSLTYLQKQSNRGGQSFVVTGNEACRSTPT